MFTGILEFKGTWRKYQARVLERAGQYLNDGKIHIVAAPGSGKTTLGVELIRRLDQPAIILAPSITIREQWKSRIQEAFLLNGIDIDSLVSQNLRKPAPITIATYQALHSAMTRTKEKPEEVSEELIGGSDDLSSENGQENQLEDFTGFDLVKAMKENGVGVICLDECHHLRSEWWKALEDFRSQMGNVRIISLTATPPYDSTPAGWKRYMDMCGEIDEEITVPELVKEGSLCPHQDFVFFNYPTNDECQAIDEFQAKGQNAITALMNDPQLFNAVRGNKAFNGQKSMDEILENPSYLSAMLIYLNAKNVPISPEYLKLLGVKSLPAVDAKWMEILLQNLLYENSEDFYCDNAYREQVTSNLKAQGLIDKRKVTLSVSTSVEKMLINSKGKINSIIQIAQNEYGFMGQSLRMLVLTDYIRKETEKLLGASDEKISETMGVLPFFENIRTHVQGARLGVLCGSIVIIPAEAKNALVEIVRRENEANVARLQFSKIGLLDESDYVKVTTAGNSHFLTGAVTDVFTAGYIQIMVGTKSLLGEGWDSPCINSLILASFVGSYMLSNQMRGRAIRVMKGQPEKTSNIWHLVCVKPLKLVEQEQREREGNVSVSEDWDLLERRMKHFMGLNYTEDIIESGINRLTCINKPFNQANIQKTNAQMLIESRKRNQLMYRWHNALTIKDSIEVVDEVEIPDRLISATVFYNALRDAVIAMIFLLATVIISVISSFMPLTALFATAALVCLVIFACKLTKVLMFGSPVKRLKKVGKAILKAMQKQRVLANGGYKVEAENVSAVCNGIYIKGGTGRDKEVFANCISEFMGEIDNQRYLLVKRRLGRDDYYAVPSIFAGNKESAQQFADCITPCIGKYDLIYTRNEQGRKILLEGRAKAYANRQERFISGKKVKGALE